MRSRNGAETINKIGGEAGEKYGINFHEDDLKKKDGFKKTMEIAKKHNLYRQNYCGCVFTVPQTS